MIVPNPDVYGAHTVASALADYLELLALHGVAMTKAELRDMISDAGWRIRNNENMAVPAGYVDEEFDDPDDRVYSLIHQRREILVDRYPFAEETSGRLVHVAGEAGDAYRALLAITLAHAYAVPSPSPPERVFEQTVADVLGARGWLSVNFGALRVGSTFAGAVTACGGPLRLQTNPEAAPHAGAAQDEGVDTLVHIPWCGGRSGRWTFIGQATCAMSNAWRAKILEPSAPLWMRFMGDVVPPVGFLAVPHHAEPKHRIYVMERSQRVLLDRLSLVQHKGGITADEETILNAVMAVGVEGPS
jgi:hypothetical protein